MATKDDLDKDANYDPFAAAKALPPRKRGRPKKIYPAVPVASSEEVTPSRCEDDAEAHLPPSKRIKTSDIDWDALKHGLGTVESGSAKGLKLVRNYLGLDESEPRRTDTKAVMLEMLLTLHALYAASDKIRVAVGEL